MNEYGLAALTQNFTAAAHHYRLAAEKDDPEAMYHLGLMYAYGRGVIQNFASAMVLFKRSAALQHAAAQLFLGKMFVHGHGVPIDYDVALTWFDKASKNAAAAATPQVADEARRARDELRQLLDQAHANMRAVGYSP